MKLIFKNCVLLYYHKIIVFKFKFPISKIKFLTWTFVFCGKEDHWYIYTINRIYFVRFVNAKLLIFYLSEL